MNKTGLVKTLAEKTGLTQKEAAKVLDSTLDSIQTALAQGDKVQIIGFGTFEVRDRKLETLSARPQEKKSRFQPPKFRRLNQESR